MTTPVSPLPALGGTEFDDLARNNASRPPRDHVREIPMFAELATPPAAVNSDIEVSRAKVVDWVMGLFRSGPKVAAEAAEPASRQQRPRDNLEEINAAIARLPIGTEATIGRNGDIATPAALTDVSRIHLHATRMSLLWLVRDGDGKNPSTYGTFLVEPDGSLAKVKGSQYVYPGQTLCLGESLDIRFPAAELPALSRNNLIKIGRGDACHMKTPGDLNVIGSHHCSFMRDDAGKYWIVDGNGASASTNGTEIRMRNGDYRTVGTAPVEVFPGQEIRLAKRYSFIVPKN